MRVDVVRLYVEDVRTLGRRTVHTIVLTQIRMSGDLRVRQDPILVGVDISEGAVRPVDRCGLVARGLLLSTPHARALTKRSITSGNGTTNARLQRPAGARWVDS